MNPWQNNDLAPNGNSVRENFLKWHGNSQILSAQGEPLVVFHGTNQPLDRFAMDRLGSSTSSVSSREGIWFTSSPDVAAEYADKASRHLIADAVAHQATFDRLLKELTAAENRGDWDRADKLTADIERHDLDAINEGSTGQCILPVYLSVQKPFIVDVKGDVHTTGLGAEIMCKARESGHDGVVFLNTADTDSRAVSHHYTVFRPEQVKSTFNCGLFLSDSSELTDVLASLALQRAAHARRAMRQTSARGVAP